MINIASLIDVPLWCDPVVLALLIGTGVSKHLSPDRSIMFLTWDLKNTRLKGSSALYAGRS